jgi:hypothetical protein
MLSRTVGNSFPLMVDLESASDSSSRLLKRRTLLLDSCKLLLVLNRMILAIIRSC